MRTRGADLGGATLLAILAAVTASRAWGSDDATTPDPSARVADCDHAGSTALTRM